MGCSQQLSAEEYSKYSSKTSPESASPAPPQNTKPLGRFSLLSQDTPRSKGGSVPSADVEDPGGFCCFPATRNESHLSTEMLALPHFSCSPRDNPRGCCEIPWATEREIPTGNPRITAGFNGKLALNSNPKGFCPLGSSPHSLKTIIQHFSAVQP